MNETDVNVTEDVPGVFDISHDGAILIFPNTIVPNPDKDYFMIEHLKMRAIFRITGVDYDHMRVDGFRKCDYTLEATDQEYLDHLNKMTIETYVMKYEDFGTDQSPIIRKDHFEYIKKLEFVYKDIVDMYMAIFYNERHECLLWYDRDRNQSIYDECLQHFVSRHSLLSIPTSNRIVIFDQKLEDPMFNYLYTKSLWRWIERDAPQNQLEKFRYSISSAERYRDSSFYDWGHQSFSVRWPIPAGVSEGYDGTYFDDRTYNIMDGTATPKSSYEQVLQLFVTGKLKSPEQIPLDVYQELLDGCNEYHLYMYTPIILYIMKTAMKFR